MFILTALLHAQSGDALIYSYDDLDRLVKVADQSGNVAVYSYDAVGNILKITRSVLPPQNGLAVLSFSPESGPVGQTVTLRGQGFNLTPGGNIVRFNGAAAFVSAASGTALTVTVPPGAATGPISVTVGGVTAVSDLRFTVLPKVLLAISVTPPSGSTLRVVEKFIATGTFSNGATQDLTAAVMWNSSNLVAAVVSNSPGNEGLATATGSGSTLITAALGSIVGSSLVKVVPLSSVEIFPATRTVAPGTVQQFVLSGAFADGISQNLTDSFVWTSSNTAVATVSSPSGGRVFANAVGNGTTTITATLGATTAAASLKVGAGTSAVVPRFAAIANSDGTISLAQVNPLTGQLRSNGYIAEGNENRAVAIDRTGRFVYVLNSKSDSVSAFTLSGSSTLAPIPGSPFAAGGFPVALAADPLGKFLYVVNLGSASISAYAIDSTSGSLTPTPNSPFIGAIANASEAPDALAIDPVGRFVFVAESGLGKIAVYSIDRQSGDLVEIAASPFVAGNDPASITVDAQGKFVYVANRGDDTVAGFLIDPATGGLTPIPGTPVSVGFGAVPVSIAAQPTGNVVYVANQRAQTVSAFSIDPASGGLTEVPGSPFTAGSLPVSITVDPSANYVYVANGINDNTVSIYGINPNTGGLINLDVVPGRAPASIAITAGTSPVTYTPEFAYVANSGPPNGSNSLSGYTISPSSGALTSVTGSPFAEALSPTSLTADFFAPFVYVTNRCSDLSCLATAGSVSAYNADSTAGVLTVLQGSPFLAGRNPLAFAIDPSGRFAYAVNSTDNTLSAYSISPVGGLLAPIPGAPFATGSGPVSVAIDSTGLFLYVVNFTGTISAYTVSGVTGAVTPVGAFQVGNAPQWAAIDPSGRFLYVANQGDATVSAMAINRTTGVLNSVAGSPFAAGQNPASVAIDPTGKFAYVANSGSADISAYAMDSSTGALTAIPNSPFAVGANPVSITVDISSSFVYVVNENDNSVSAFSIDPATGALTPVFGSPFGTGTKPVSVTTTGKIQ